MALLILDSEALRSASNALAKHIEWLANNIWAAPHKHPLASQNN